MNECDPRNNDEMSIGDIDFNDLTQVLNAYSFYYIDDILYSTDIFKKYVYKLLRII